jgi:hypothetical protein
MDNLGILIGLLIVLLYLNRDKLKIVKKKVKPEVSKYVAADWVKKVILSCTTYKHLHGCSKLVSNFSRMYNDHDLYQYLWEIKSNQRDVIYKKLIKK